MSIAVVLLAAGQGSRFTAGGHKLLAPLRGRAVYAWALDHAIAAGLGDVLVVSGPAVLELPAGAVAVPNPEWRRGQMTSLRAGLAAAAARGAASAVVGLADQPFIEPSAWRAVAAADAPIAVATYGGRRGNPVRLDRTVWDLLAESGDEGARSLMRLRPDLVSEVPCEGSPADIDTVEDLERWSSSTNSPSTGPSIRPGRC
jgi:CTP:molybdopterin cytidylyltransferase MocA